MWKKNWQRHVLHASSLFDFLLLCSASILSRVNHYTTWRLIPRTTRPPPTVGRRRGSCRVVSPQVSPGRPWCRGHCRQSCPGPVRASSNSGLDETGNPPRRSSSTHSSCSPPIWKTNILHHVLLSTVWIICSSLNCFSSRFYLGWHSLPIQKSWTGSGLVKASQYISCTSTPS